VKRRLVAILAADVVDYSRLMAEDEEATLSQLKAHRADLFDPCIAEHGGRVIKLMGDGTLAEFASVVDAVKCAIAIQTALAETSGPIRLRIGVNLGDVIVDGDDIYGDGVNIAARLEAIAEPGGVCISDIVLQSVRSKSGVTFEDIGEQNLKNIDQPVRIWHWSGLRGGDTATSIVRSLALPDKPSIAVLPFDNLSGDPEQDYFADGLTDDVIGQLARFRSLFVIGSTSSFPYKGQSPKVAEVGRELGVAYVARGGIRKAGNRVRISVELVEVATGRQLWSERYDSELEDIFALQDEVASKIVSTLAGHVEDTGRLRAAGKHTSDLGAYDLVLLGEYSERTFSKEGILKARDLFQKAIDRDPGNARAHASMARTYLDELWADWTIDRDAAAEQAFYWAQKAVALDGLDNRARTNLGVAYQECKGNLDAAQAQFAKALELNPNDADAYCQQGWCHVYASEGDAAITCTDWAMRLSPFDNYYCYMAQFFAHYAAGRFTAALAALDRISEPDYVIHAFRAACFAQLGRDAEARQAMDAYLTTAQDAIALWPGEDPIAWRQHWTRSQPFRDPADLEHLLDGFRKAGMPV